LKGQTVLATLLSSRRMRYHPSRTQFSCSRIHSRIRLHLLQQLLPRNGDRCVHGQNQPSRLAGLDCIRPL